MVEWRAAARLALTLGLAASTASTPRVARADDVDRCLAAHPEAQRLRRAGQLRATREQLLVCAREACPSVVRAECAQWLREVDDAMPSVVFAARDRDGGDLVDLAVTVDGKLALSRVDGRELALDPGAHVVRFEREGYAPVQETVVVLEHEKGRPIVVTMARLPPPPPPLTPAPPRATEAAPAPARSHAPAGAYVLGAVGVGALASFAFFGLRGRSDYFTLKDQCAPTCTSDQVSSMHTSFVVADVSLVVSLVSLGAAAYLLLSSHEASPARHARLERSGVPAP